MNCRSAVLRTASALLVGGQIHQKNAGFPVVFRKAYFYQFCAGCRKIFANVIGADRQFSMPSVDQHIEAVLHTVAYEEYLERMNPSKASENGGWQYLPI